MSQKAIVTEIVEPESERGPFFPRRQRNPLLARLFPRLYTVLSEIFPRLFPAVENELQQVRGANQVRRRILITQFSYTPDGRISSIVELEK